ncbi:MAG: glycosyltransferase [Nitrosomonas sp.]|nr:MAG: glycosyltransferase [Nitrosomonas sp.]
MPIIGCFDLINHNHAIGWALVTEQLKKRVTVEIVAEDQLVASGFANCLYKALAEKGVGDGYYGFVIPLPSNILIDTANLRARVAGSGEWLKGEHAFSSITKKAKPEGSIDGIVSGVLFGWVASEALTAQPDIIVCLGDKTIGYAQIGLPRQDIVTLGIADEVYSFQFDLSPFLKIKRTFNRPITLTHTATGALLPGSPLNLNEVRGWGHVAALDGINLMGWATLSGPSDTVAIVELWIDGVRVLAVPADQARADFVRMGIAHSRCGFKITIPGCYLDGKPHVLNVRHQATQTILPGGEQTFTITLRYAVTNANATEIDGWLFMEQAPLQHLTVEAWENKRSIAQVTTDSFQPPVPDELRQQFGVGAAGFRLPLPQAANIHVPRRIRLSVAGAADAINGKDILIAPIAYLIRETERAAQADTALRWWASDWIAELRNARVHDGTLFKVIPAEQVVDESLAIDIIVPVYKGRKETLACLHSLLNAPETIAHEIIVINDASPDVNLSAELRKLAKADPRVILLENESNVGFVATVNRGMTLHPDRDVLLLNSDTLIPTSDWLSRIQSAAKAEPMIATVTPFSNRATICSLPTPNVDNDLPDGLSVTDLDALCAQANPGVRIEIPTAIGFCMYIKRAALNEVGLFDAERWTKGYGEENDFCFKAASIGWKHVVTCDVFIQHYGAVSFQNERQIRVQENLIRLNAIYPDYSAAIDRFIRKDPLSIPRNQVVLQLMQQAMRREKVKSHILHITHAWGGGVQHHVNQLCNLPAIQGKSLYEGGLILRPTNDGRAEIIQPYAQLALSFSLGEIEELIHSASSLIKYLEVLGVTAVHMHQWIGLPPTIWQLHAVLGVPLDYSVHDYYSFCPRIHLLDHTGQFCRQAPLSRCELCVKAKSLEPQVKSAFVALGGSVKAWRAFHHNQLIQARQISAPSQDAVRRLKQAYPLKRVVFKPHEFSLQCSQPKPLPQIGEEMRVAVIGAIGLNKGYDSLLALVQLAEVEAPNLLFFIVGYTMDDAPFHTLSNVRITGEYAQSELQNLLTKLDCHIALFLSPWPETYSYTLSEAIMCGLTQVVPNLGALGERVAKRNMGILLPENPSPTQIISTLQALATPSFKG